MERGKRSNKKTSEDKQTRQNSFKILQEVEKNVETDPIKDNIPKEQDMEAKMEDIPVNDQKIDGLKSSMKISKDQKMTPSDTGMEDHELQEILDRENLDLEQFLEQGKNKGVDSLPKEDYDRVQKLYLRRVQSKGTGAKRKYESQEWSGLKVMENP